MAAARSARARPWAPGELPPPSSGPAALWQAWRQRWRRQKLLARAIRKRRELRLIQDRSKAIGKDTILCAMVIRNEARRLPWFLDYHRRLGIGHFLIIDNDSTDGSRALLEAAADVTLWSTPASYKQSRFGLDWLNWVLMRHGHGHWCLVLDADELLVYPHSETRPLPALTEWLDLHQMPAMPAMMLDLYPEGHLSDAEYRAGEDPLQSLPWFDSGNYITHIQPGLRNLWIQGGPRSRQFFPEDPRRAPTLNKIPLVRWHWRYAFLNSTHSLLPPRLNHIYDETGGESLSGVLLHTKFLPEIIEKSGEEKTRGQHFGEPQRFGRYYDALIADPVLKTTHSRRYQGWRQLEALGLLSRGGWL